MESFNSVYNAVIIGIGATMFMDIAVVIRAKISRVPSLDWAMVGRWVGHMPRGVFAHDAIGRADQIHGERALGWSVHYATGVALALLIGEWLTEPNPVVIIGYGAATVVLPFAIMQPGLGLGFAASRTPKPNLARWRSVITHTLFGVGLYLSALLVNLVG